MSADPVYTGPEICKLSARDVIALLKNRKISAAELVEASLKRITQTGPAINAMVTQCPDRARDAATRATTDTMLAGLPIGIKDLTPVAGVRTTFGTPALSDHVPTESDPMVTRLESRGGIVMGKTNTPEMGAGANTFNPIFGATRNPWDTVMNAGGSSGGAAAGLATGEVWLSQGSDLGGSLRTPASFCGIVGLRPSPGVAGGGSATDGFATLPTNGPMARNVADCALMLDAMAGFDPVWPTSYPAPKISYLASCLANPGSIRIAFSADLGGLGPVDTEMELMLADAMRRVAGETIEITHEDPDIHDVDDTFRTFRALAMYSSASITPERIKSQYKPTLQRNIAQGGHLHIADVSRALIARSRLFDTMRAFLGRYDVLACPVSGIAPLPVEIEYPPEVAGVRSTDYLDWLRFAFLATLCGLPALSLPIGRTKDGLPVGIQLIGQPRGEARLLQIARVLEKRLGFPATPIDPVLRHTA